VAFSGAAAAAAAAASVAIFRRCASGVVISPRGIGVKPGTESCIMDTAIVPRQNLMMESDTIRAHTHTPHRRTHRKVRSAELGWSFAALVVYSYGCGCAVW
jgi:hypothetical protein